MPQSAALLWFGDTRVTKRRAACAVSSIKVFAYKVLFKSFLASRDAIFISQYIFKKGTCTVHAVTPRSPLRGVTKAGDTLLSVNGQPVTPTTILDVIKAADDGTSERKLVFRTTAPAMKAGGTPAGMTAGHPVPATPADAWLPIMPPPPPTGQNFCTACGAPVQGRFCRQCGAPTSKH